MNEGFNRHDAKGLVWATEKMARYQGQIVELQKNWQSHKIKWKK